LLLKDSKGNYVNEDLTRKTISDKSNELATTISENKLKIFHFKNTSEAKLHGYDQRNNHR